MVPNENAIMYLGIKFDRRKKESKSISNNKSY